MPGRDGTGPAGMGPMTGRAAGYCAGYAAPGYANPVGGRGFCGMGRGGGGRGGRGRRNQFYATGLTGWQRDAMGVTFNGPIPPEAIPFAPAVSNEQQMEVLKGQATYLEEALNDIRNRIEGLEEKTKQD